MSTGPPLLPTLDRRNSTVPEDVSPTIVAENWLELFRTTVSGRGSSPTDLFLPDAFWRDAIAVTSDYRTLRGLGSIQRLLTSRVQPSLMSDLVLSTGPSKAPALRTPFPDFALIQACFDFKTSLGSGTAVVRLVPVEGGEWKAYTLYTCLDSLSQFPEKVLHTLFSNLQVF